MKEGRVVVDKNNEFVLDDNNRLQITPRPTKGDTNEEVSEEEDYSSFPLVAHSWGIQV